MLSNYSKEVPFDLEIPRSKDDFIQFPEATCFHSPIGSKKFPENAAKPQMMKVPIRF